MLPLRLDTLDDTLHVVALGAHPDDVEIGCGGTLLRLAAQVPRLSVEIVIATGDPQRRDEARRAADLFLPGAGALVRFGDLPDGRLPAHWNDVKDLLADTAGQRDADVVLTPRLGDAHQDHRTVAEIAPTVWRDQLILGYEIPKWDGDLGQPAMYVGLDETQMREKVVRLHKAYPSQADRAWFDDEVFYGLARLRGMECRMRYAEAFTVGKAALTW